jgi:hypothetical protein
VEDGADRRAPLGSERMKKKRGRGGEGKLGRAGQIGRKYTGLAAYVCARKKKESGPLRVVGPQGWLGGLKREKGRGGRGLVFFFFQTFSNIKLLQVFSRFKFFSKILKSF